MFKAMVVIIVMGSQQPIPFKDTRPLSPNKEHCVKRYKEMMKFLQENNNIIIHMRGYCKQIQGA